MRKLYFAIALVALLGFGISTPAFAHDVGIHCIQFGPDHPGCGGGDDDNDNGGAGNTNTNTNTNTSNSSSHNLNTAFGGDAKAYGGDGGNAEVGNGFGNFSPESKSTSSAHQGQEQGQIQGQGQFGYVDTDLTVEGDTNITDIDNDFPVNTAAPVFAGNCAQGVSAQLSSFGGSIASGNSVCDYIAVAGAYIAGGDRAEAFRVLGKAESAADWRFLFSRVRMVLTLGLL